MVHLRCPSEHRHPALGTFPNSPANLEKWIQAPARLKPGTAMPDMNVGAEDSRDIAAYLFSLN
jgi:cytochrome c1